MLRSFLLGILPQGVVVIRGQVNRVPQPANQNYVLMQDTRQTRLRTNVDVAADCLFTASIATNVMAVTEIITGAIDPPAQMFGTGLANGSATVVSQITGPAGGTGTYLITPAQGTVGAALISAGGEALTQGGEWVIQLEVHGPQSAENAITITTLFRDTYAVDTFAALNPAMAPLYADDPKQIPFINDSQQYEDRYIIEAHLQVNQTLTIPQQYMDDVEVTLIDVDATFPPS